MNAAIRARRGVRRDWTAADIESCLVLIDIGASRPAAKVTRARRGRPLRRAYRAALRTAAQIPHTNPIPKEVVGR
ncbi:hypothetical protein [Streptomyces sp. NPDC013489]|uniref:hypothetical protein n=1 Tax=Streptomyces sp. NPDC013489 TaxID=3155606 RepID=UPI0033FC6421